jgi:DNA-binding winged helix-turn-helix (wHTH) protein
MGGESFFLSPRLAQLLQFLAAGAQEGSDKRALVSWKSKIEIAAYMEKRARKAISRGYVSYMIHRLRRVLKDSHYDPNLIQSHPQNGYRLALRQGGILNSPKRPA